MIILYLTHWGQEQQTHWLFYLFQNLQNSSNYVDLWITYPEVEKKKPYRAATVFQFIIATCNAYPKVPNSCKFKANCNKGFKYVFTYFLVFKFNSVTCSANGCKSKYLQRLIFHGRNYIVTAAVQYFFNNIHYLEIRYFQVSSLFVFCLPPLLESTKKYDMCEKLSPFNNRISLYGGILSCNP